MKQYLTALEIQEARERGFLGSMVADERMLFDMLPIDKQEAMEYLYGPGQQEFFHYSEEDDGEYSCDDADYRYASLEEMENSIDAKNGTSIYQLHLKHLDFKEYIIEKLREVETKEDLYEVVSECAEHDIEMEMFGYICNTVKQLWKDFDIVEKRLDCPPLPAMMYRVADNRKSISKAVAFSPKEYRYLKGQGYCVLILPIRKEVKV